MLEKFNSKIHFPKASLTRAKRGVEMKAEPSATTRAKRRVEKRFISLTICKWAYNTIVVFGPVKG